MHGAKPGSCNCSPAQSHICVFSSDLLNTVSTRVPTKPVCPICEEEGQNTTSREEQGQQTTFCETGPQKLYTGVLYALLIPTASVFKMDPMS